MRPYHHHGPQVSDVDGKKPAVDVPASPPPKPADVRSENPPFSPTQEIKAPNPCLSGGRCWFPGLIWGARRQASPNFPRPGEWNQRGKAPQRFCHRATFRNAPGCRGLEA